MRGSILFTSILLAAPLFAQAGDPDPVAEVAPQLKQFVDVFTAVEREAADPIDADAALYQGAIPSMLHTLDPHSSFFDPDQFEQLRQMEQSEQKGFGSIVNITPGRVIVLQTLPGTPSSKVGLSAGDEIVAVNNYAIARLDAEQIVQLLTASRQKEADLYIHHPGDANVQHVTMSPALVDTPTVDRAFILAPGIAYVRITEFAGPTAKLVRDGIEKLGGADLKGLVLDLRDNPGGDVMAAIDTATLFLPSDALIFTAKGRTSKPEEARVKKYNRPYTFPIAILVNEKTASAAEIVSGALQDHDRATILGESTYGKGLVQQVYTLSKSTGMALTTAFYYTPSGRSIQKPLNGGLLDAATVVDKGPFKTDSGREVRGGGGIQPDQVVKPELQSRLRLALDASGVITAFAGEYIRAHDLPGEIAVTGAMLDQLNAYAAARSIQPDVREWLADRKWIESRLQQELVNLKSGVEKGDEIEIKRDPVAMAALEALATR